MLTKTPIVLCIWAMASFAQAQTSLHEKLIEALTVWTTPTGQRVVIAHCRYARMGCAKRVELLAQWIEEAAARHGVDPLVLAAIALHESGMNPFALGSVGEAGIMQLHPRGVGRNLRFVRDERYRDRCKRVSGACQQQIIERAASLLAIATIKCGSIPRALGYYNSGHCQHTAYSGRVLRKHQALSGLIP